VYLSQPYFQRPLFFQTLCVYNSYKTSTILFEEALNNQGSTDTTPCFYRICSVSASYHRYQADAEQIRRQYGTNTSLRRLF